MQVFISYILPRSRAERQRYSVKELLLSEIGIPQHQPYSKNFFNIRTFIAEPRDCNMMLLENLLQREYTKEYIQFRIPKASGGTRLIKAPVNDLKDLQAELTSMIQNVYGVLPHDSAYAYTRGRCAYDALVTHQRKNARWFLKIDIKDFFPSITTDVLKKTLPQVYPLNWLAEEQMDRLIDIATDEGSLPQGSPLSPLLSNLVMIEFDKIISSKLRRYKNQSYTYTRYADDMLISSAYDFKFQDIVDLIESVFKDLELPFTISRHKLRYASKAGRNWNLGLMYNQDQRITVGTKRKKELHSLINSFVVEYPWDVHSTQELIGKLGYLKNVEPDYYRTLINKYEQKYQVNISRMFSNILNGVV